MDQQSLRFVFNCCVLGGLVLPVLDVAIGALGGALDLDLDFDGDVGFDGPLPINLMSLSFTVVVFGAVGRLFLGKLPLAAVFLAAAFCGLLGGGALMKFIIMPLKRNRAYAAGIEDLKLKEGVVKLELRSDFVGTITVLSATGSKVTYSAKPDADIDKIPVGQKVVVVDIDPAKKICIVRPLKTTKARDF